MTAAPVFLTQRERELGAIINAYNEVAERLKAAHERLNAEVVRLRDQVAEKNRELARRERLAALGQMAAGVAHEIRNPLAGIQLYATLLVKDLAELDKPRGYARKIVLGVESLEAIVGDVLDFAGEHTPQRGPCELAPIVAEIRAASAPLCLQRGTTLHCAAEVENFTLNADGRQVQQALLNLVRNALQATGPAGNVWMEASDDAEYVVIRVVDDGPGVPAELRERIFNPFFTTKDVGTGLGLAIVHRIAEAHGGGVCVSERPGGGACFALTLPRWQAPVGKIAIEGDTGQRGRNV